jgi:hypothetical protein
MKKKRKKKKGLPLVPLPLRNMNYMMLSILWSGFKVNKSNGVHDFTLF